jgi:endonuclease YncB( thermonuclease family)
MNELVFGKNVELRPHAVDRYDRTVVQVFVDGRDAGLELLKQGLAWVYE